MLKVSVLCITNQKGWNGSWNTRWEMCQQKVELCFIYPKQYFRLNKSLCHPYPGFVTIKIVAEKSKHLVMSGNQPTITLQTTLVQFSATHAVMLKVVLIVNRSSQNPVA